MAYVEAMAFTDSDHAQLISALRHDARHFGPTLAKLAFERGLAVTAKETGVLKPIPVTATPVIIDATALKARQTLAARISSATVKMVKAALGGEFRDLVIKGLSPLERSLCEATWPALDTLVTTRVDFFVGQTVKALEVNATIPAMQGYSDIAANTLIETAGKAWGLNDVAISRLQANNGSNALALFRALLSGYGQVRRGQQPQTIALLSRRNDAQLTEQKYLCEQFRNFGADAHIVHPDQLSSDGTRVFANGVAFDLIYRHLFVRRLEEADMQGAALVKELLAERNGTRVVILNPPASQVEVKAVFALLSMALEDQALAKAAKLSADELSAIETTVPWTRPFSGDALVKQVAADPDAFVLKRSWDYGGRAVFVGKSRATPGFSERVQTAYGSPLDWAQVCERAAADQAGGGFVVQRIVETNPEPHLLCSGDSQHEADLYVDFSAYASVGLDAQPHWGGVCRGSMSQIVNIVGGGGVIPLLTTDVAASLLNASRAGARPRL